VTAPPPGYSPGPATGPQPPVGPPTGPQQQVGPPTGPQPFGQPAGPYQQVGPYQPAGTPPYAVPPQAFPPRRVKPPRTTPRWVAGLLAGIAFLIAAGATVWGSFEKTQSFRFERQGTSGGDPDVSFYDVTWWRIEQSADSFGEYPPYGIVVAVAAGLLLIGAVLAMTAFGVRRSGLVTGARVSAAAGVGLLAGGLTILLLDALQGLSNTNQRDVDPGETVSFQVGLGIWLPAGAAGLALIGLILALTRPRTALARQEPATPPMGFRSPYGPGPYQQQVPPQPFQHQQPGPQTGPQPVATPAAPTEPRPAAEPGPQAEPAPQPESGSRVESALLGEPSRPAESPVSAEPPRRTEPPAEPERPDEPDDRTRSYTPEPPPERT
jgi:hypothetical protein